MKTLLILSISCICLFSQSKVDSLENLLENNTSNIALKLKLAISYHDMVVLEENDKATERAEELFKSILNQKRDHAEARAFYGSLITLKGRDAFLPWKKMSYVEEGCDEMDKAAKIEPNNVMVRLIRGLNNIELPSFFKRISYSLEDLEFVRNHPAFKSFSNQKRQEVFFSSAKAFMENDEAEKAIKMYEEVVTINKNSGLGKKAYAIISE